MYESNAFRSLPSNPFSSHEAAVEQQARYRESVAALAQHYIYNVGKLDAADIARTIGAKQHTQILQPIEKENRGLESLHFLLRGIEAQERADLIFGGAWQAALLRQIAQRPMPPKPPETLTRDEVAREFEAFYRRQNLLEAEKEALENYTKLLAVDTFSAIRVDKKGETAKASEKIEITRSDVEALVNDLRVRMAERMADHAARRQALHGLDEELKEIISRIPDEQTGKRFEIEVIYLMRRLIHAADEGHLVSVFHTSPRVDLRKDMGNADIELDVAGKVFMIQLKTLNRGAGAEARDIQLMVLDRAAKKAKETGAELITLDSGLVRRSYASSVEKDTEEDILRISKKEAVEPLLEMVEEEFGRGVLKLFSLTESDMESELAELRKNQEERERFDEDRKKMREEEIAREAATEAAAKAAAEQAAIDTAAKEQAEQERQRQAVLAAQAERDATVRAKQERLKVKQGTREAERAEREAREAAEKAAADAAAEKTRKAEERRQKKEEKKLETGGWPPENLVGLFTSDVLKVYGFLPEDWKGDTARFLTAKKNMLARFAKTKKGATPSDRDAPSKDFKYAFPTKDILSSPTPEDIARIRNMIG
ncbi:MAG: hypothetical protein RDU25_06120 [Patescibacteria group bacterium]|nr:hypothetical protein [Patescibacteria group bacterium]